MLRLWTSVTRSSNRLAFIGSCLVSGFLVFDIQINARRRYDNYNINTRFVSKGVKPADSLLPLLAGGGAVVAAQPPAAGGSSEQGGAV